MIFHHYILLYIGQTLDINIHALIIITFVYNV